MDGLPFAPIEHVGKVTHLYDTLKVGRGDFDYIGIHRVTRERCKWSKVSMFMIPGANMNFQTAFMDMAIFFALRGVDVWGIDFRYSFVPNDMNGSPYCKSSSCDFMKDWNTEMMLSDLDNVIKIAKVATNSSPYILGWSQGAYYAYRYASENKDICGLIPMDMPYDIDPANTDIISRAASEVSALKAKMSGGIYYQDSLTFRNLASLSQDNPTASSALIPGLNNKQAFIFFLTNTYKLKMFTLPNYRYYNGHDDALLYTDYNYALGQALNLNAYQGLKPSVEMYSLWTGKSAVPKIDAPVFYVGSEFGFGEYGFYTPMKIHEFNKDVKGSIVMDYGHNDLLYSKTAQYDVWSPICQWMREEITGYKK